MQYYINRYEVFVLLNCSWFIVESKSPEQISLRLKIEFKDKTMRISHEAIYQYVYSQINSNGKVKKNGEDLIYLPRKRKRRMKKGFRQAKKLYKTKHYPQLKIDLR